MKDNLEHKTKDEPLCKSPKEGNSKGICNKDLRECPYYILATRDNLSPASVDLMGKFGFCDYKN